MTRGATLTQINVLLTIKSQESRKRVIIPGANAAGYHPNSTYQEALVIAIAHAYRWKKLLDEGNFEFISDLVREIGLDVSFAARLLRLTLLTPDIIEAILAGEAPNYRLPCHTSCSGIRRFRYLQAGTLHNRETSWNGLPVYALLTQSVSIISLIEW